MPVYSKFVSHMSSIGTLSTNCMIAPKSPIPPQSRMSGSKVLIGPSKRRKVHPQNCLPIDDGMTSVKILVHRRQSVAKSSKPLNRFEKAEAAIYKLITTTPGLSLDQFARQEVIQTLDEMDCLSDDDENARNDRDNEQYMSLKMISPIFGSDKILQRKPEYNRYEGVTKEFLRYQREIDRQRIRKNNIERAIKAMVAIKQEKDELYRISMVANIKEKTSVKSQQARRLAIGFVSRLVNKCKNIVADR